MRFLESVQRGPACRFSDAHVYFVLHTLEKNGRMGRRNLADAVGIGEGSLRTLIANMKGWDLLDIKQTGVALSDVGRQFISNISMELVDVPCSRYVLGQCQCGILIHGVADSITDGMTQRDIAIVSGADGASVFLMKGGALMMPPFWNMDDRDPEFASELRSSVRIGEDDVLVISGAKDPYAAAVSAIAVGLEMLRSGTASRELFHVLHPQTASVQWYHS